MTSSRKPLIGAVDSVGRLSGERKPRVAAWRTRSPGISSRITRAFDSERAKLEAWDSRSRMMRVASVRDTAAEFKVGHRQPSFRGLFPIVKLSISCQPSVGRKASDHKVSRQVPPRHVLAR